MRFGSPFSSNNNFNVSLIVKDKVTRQCQPTTVIVVGGHCLVTLSLTINQTLKWIWSLPILMQESFWWWQCSDRYIIYLYLHLCTPFLPPPPTLPTPFSSSLISFIISVHVKHHVYLLTYCFPFFTHLPTSNVCYDSFKALYITPVLLCFISCLMSTFHLFHVCTSVFLFIRDSWRQRQTPA